MENYEIDNLDKKLISILQKNSRTPFLEIARTLNVSGGTIHVRLSKLEAAGIINQYALDLNPKELGLNVCTLVAITLHSTAKYQKVLSKLKSMKEIVDAWYTTGNFSLMLRIYSKDMEDFHSFLLNKLQKIEEIQSTQTFVVMDSPIKRNVNVV